MRKYEQLAQNIVENIGGKENVVKLTHCVTRLRFVLKDESKANDKAVKDMDGVITLMKSAGQYQVVIGNHVPDVYDEVCGILGFLSEEVFVEEKKKNIGEFLIDFISGVMMPCIGMLCASGMIKGILSIFTFFGWLPTTSGIYLLLSASGDALFYFFPILLGYTTAKKMKIEPFVGLLIGAGLVYPSIQSVDLNIFGLTVNTTYTSTVLPVIFTVIFASFIYKPLMKIIPDVIKTFFVPMIVLMVSIPIGFIVIGPVMNAISGWLGNAIDACYGFSPILAGVVIGSLYQIMVIFGIHGALGAIAMIQLSAGQPTFLGLMVGTTFAQTAVVFAIWLKTKNKNLKNIALPAIISGIFGVTEPAIYGITLPRIKFFVISCIGAGLTGAYLGLTNTMLYQLTGMGIFTIPGFIGGSAAVPAIIINVLIALAIGMGFSFICTFILFKDEEKETSKEAGSKKAAVSDELFTPIKGKVLPLSEAQDEAFASGAIGKGVVIEPSEGEVYAPITGTVTTLFPTLHAIGITGDNGVEILIHIGLNTVRLDGNGFVAHVKQGDKVKKGQLLLDFDRDFIKKSGYSVQTIVVITNGKDLLDVIGTDKASIELNSPLFTVIY